MCCRFSPQKGKTKLQRETERIEEQYRRKKEEKVRKMLERLSSEQRARVASLIQKHSQQMLELIAEKLTSLEVCFITNCLTSFIKLISHTDGETGHRSVVNNGEAGVVH